MTDNLYWDLESHPHTDSYTDTVAKVSDLVRDAVKRQMVSDVPVCTFLSGGIDSSIVTAIAQKYLSIMKSYCQEFGLSPSSRSGISAENGGDSSDDMMENLLSLGGDKP